jgi:CheY-like chemotaxis protein
MTAMQGSVGLVLARDHVPDLILLDLNLPDVSGEEVLLRLLSDPQTAEIPVVVLSADATKGQVKRLLDAGARAYLTKPIDVATFYEVLDEHCAEPVT